MAKGKTSPLQQNKFAFFIINSLIDNKIANKYWEKNLKNFDFKSIQNDNYRLQDFIRDKYERKKWINKKEKDPMTLIIEGEEDSDDDDDDENEEEEEEFVAVEEDDDNDKGAKNKKDVNQENPNLFDFIPGFNAGNNTVNGTQQINNIFVINNQQNAMNNNSNINLLGDYKPETQQDMQRNHLMNNLQQVYTHLNTNYQNTNNAFNQGMPNMNKNNYSNNNFTKNQQQIPSNVLMNNNMNMNTMNTNLVGYQPGMNCNLMNNYSINNKPAIPIYSPNQNTFNIELYNKTKSESNNKQLDNNSNCINKNNFNSNSLRQKKEDDPFKNLVSFK